MSTLPNQHDLHQRLQDYRIFDQARQSEIEFLAQTCLKLDSERLTLQSDLDDERATRRTWKRRAEEAEVAVQRKFVVVLVDADGYIFRKVFFQALAASGGSKAANELYTEVVNNLRSAEAGPAINADCDVLVNVYANKAGLARTLAAADYLNHPSQIDHFFGSFTQSRSLFQFIDCGQGKERVDAKLRDTFRFYAYNAQCQRVYLAFCHDIGYIAELDKYRHDAIVMPKVMLIQAAQTAPAARAYAGLPFKSTRFDSVFETSPLDLTHRVDAPYGPTGFDALSLGSSPEQATDHSTPSASRSSYSSVSGPPGLTPLMPLSTNNKPANHVRSPTPPAEIVSKPPVKPQIQPQPQPQVAQVHNGPNGASETKPGIPINRQGQRIDLKMRMPTTSEMERFEERISQRRKLCNEHHLRDNCESYNCKYDHDPIDASMRNTLRYKARSIPCAHGSKCRRQDCFYGHQCPWGNNSCGNLKCAFLKTGLHDIRDLEVAKFVPAQPGA
ncbi:hypothetical protein A1O3_02736 [Capronia epimyces CBS 606.96]|uniref:C3H1-type domain-containing protein n=1 Tax=Capronia epimyces CBS 606.96 TaxID=1182542 RepID=W9Z593_9EURO|nr:uncharacterized protein A1O3_02736 [Capronia epimyces CBS 606.96]EXJ89669.1 hypothetical protein A1O3_02736 [Capronia epimyces CBS 606.96]